MAKDVNDKKGFVSMINKKQKKVKREQTDASGETIPQSILDIEDESDRRRAIVIHKANMKRKKQQYGK